jgi:hypothetical protein
MMSAAQQLMVGIMAISNTEQALVLPTCKNVDE